MKRILLALLAGGTVTGAVAGAAATLDLDGGVLQSGSDIDLTCADDVDVAWGVETDGRLFNAKLSGLEDCDGEKIIVSFNGTEALRAIATLDSTSTNRPTIGSASTNQVGGIPGGVLTVNFPTTPPADSINSIRVVIHSGS